MSKFFSGRRRRARGSLLGPALHTLAAAALFSFGCASRGVGASGVEQIGGRESTLADCAQHGRLCAGLTVAVLDLEVAAGRACFPDGVTLEQAEDVVAEALKAGTSNEPAEIAADAIRATWPCAAAPTEITKAAVMR
jgi:hypothetical protein